MGRPIIFDIIERPISTVLIITCSSIWLYIQKKGVGYADVGLSYEAVVHDGQYWRILTAAFSHITFLHLLFNMSALWSLGVVETLGAEGLGKVYYLKNSLVLLVLSGGLVLGMYHLLIFRFRLEHYKRVTAVGYSCVVFGWMTILAVKQPVSKLELFGVVPLPVHLAPFESLILTSIIVPQASFVGHLAGILVGYLVAWGMLQGLSSYWACTLAIWLAIGFVISLRQTSSFEMPYLQIESVADPSLAPMQVTLPTRTPTPAPLPVGDDRV